MPTHFYRQPLVSAWTSSLHEMVCLCSFVLHITRDVLAFVDWKWFFCSLACIIPSKKNSIVLFTKRWALNIKQSIKQLETVELPVHTTRCAMSAVKNFFAESHVTCLVTMFHSVNDWLYSHQTFATRPFPATISCRETRFLFIPGAYDLRGRAYLKLNHLSTDYIALTESATGYRCFLLEIVGVAKKHVMCAIPSCLFTFRKGFAVWNESQQRSTV